MLVLWGESPFLLRLEAQESLGDVRATEVDGAAWAPGATSDLATPSLLGEARALVVGAAQELDEAAREEVAAYAADPAPGARLVLLAEVGPRAKGPPAALMRALPKGVEVRRVAVERRDLPGWLGERARRRGLRASPGGAAALVETLGEDPAVLDQAVEQLASAFPDQGLTPETVRAQFRGLGDRRIWELSEAAYRRDLPGALRVLASMLEAREEPLAILGGLAARLRELMRVRAVPERTPPAEVARAAGLRFEWQARRLRDQSRRFTDSELTAVHADLVEADRALKQGGPGDVVLARVLARIAARGGGRGSGGRVREPAAEGR